MLRQLVFAVDVRDPVLQPELSHQLRERKLRQLLPTQPDCIVSANVGCIQRLQSGTGTPVRHWVEVVDKALARRSWTGGCGPR